MNHFDINLITRPARLEALRQDIRGAVGHLPWAMAQLPDAPLPDTVVLAVNVTCDEARELVLAAAARHGAVLEMKR